MSLLLITIITFLWVLFQTPDISFNLPLVASVAAFIALPLKIVVDIIRGAWTSLPGKALPVVGVAVGYALALLLMIASGSPKGSAVLAQLFFAALAAQAGAMAASGAQNQANKKRADANGDGGDVDRPTR